MLRLLLAAVALLPVGSAHAAGPPLTVPADKLAAALTCTPDLATAKHDPVLLTPAFSTAEQSYGFNYLHRLPELGIPVCSVSVEDNGFGDLQTTAEYDVFAIRHIAAVSHRKVIVLGHQHGALDHLWAMTFWPDVARRVSDFVSLATPYHGTASSSGLCTPGSGRCAPSLWQITKGSAFLAARAAAPLPPGPSYTSIATTSDELITPEPEASRLDGGRSMTVQDVCPGRSVDHFMILSDAVAYALVLDAIDHPGPADPARIPTSVCDEQSMPGATQPDATGFLATFLARNVADAVSAEPAIRPYAERRGPKLEILTRRARRSRTSRIRVRVSCQSVATTACRVTIGAASRIARPGRTPVLRVRVPRRGRHVYLTLAGRDALGNAATAQGTVRLSRAL